MFNIFMGSVCLFYDRGLGRVWDRKECLHIVCTTHKKEHWSQDQACSVNMYIYVIFFRVLRSVDRFHPNIGGDAPKFHH